MTTYCFDRYSGRAECRCSTVKMTWYVYRSRERLVAENLMKQKCASDTYSPHKRERTIILPEEQIQMRRLGQYLRHWVEATYVWDEVNVKQFFLIPSCVSPSGEGDNRNVREQIDAQTYVAHDEQFLHAELILRSIRIVYSWLKEYWIPSPPQRTRLRFALWFWAGSRGAVP